MDEKYLKVKVDESGKASRSGFVVVVIEGIDWCSYEVPLASLVSRRPELDELKIAETLWYHDRTDLFFPNIGKNEPFEKIKGTDLYDLYINRAKSICAKFSTPEAVELIEALKYCLWKLENTYELIHVNYACTPDGRPWHTKETYRETEEAKQFAKAIDQAKKVLSNHKDASCP